MSTSLDPAQDRYFEPGAPDVQVDRYQAYADANGITREQAKTLMFREIYGAVVSVPASVLPAPVAATAHHADIKQSRDKAVYTREQKGHSILLHVLFGMVVLWIPAMYITASPRHYWHL